MSTMPLFWNRPANRLLENLYLLHACKPGAAKEKIEEKQCYYEPGPRILLHKCMKLCMKVCACVCLCVVVLERGSFLCSRVCEVRISGMPGLH